MANETRFDLETIFHAQYKRMCRVIARVQGPDYMISPFERRRGRVLQCVAPSFGGRRVTIADNRTSQVNGRPLLRPRPPGHSQLAKRLGGLRRSFGSPLET